jgi:hypothetical protein
MGGRQWNKTTLLESLKSWYQDRSMFSLQALPCYVIWRIRLSKNNMIFEGKVISTSLAAHKIRVSFEGSWEPFIAKVPRTTKEISTNSEMAWASSTMQAKGP